MPINRTYPTENFRTLHWHTKVLTIAELKVTYQLKASFRQITAQGGGAPNNNNPGCKTCVNEGECSLSNPWDQALIKLPYLLNMGEGENENVPLQLPCQTKLTSILILLKC